MKLLANCLLMCGLFGFVTSERSLAEPDKEKLAALTKDLKHKDSKVRIAAAEEIGKLGADAKPIVRDLCDAILDKNADVSLAAFKSLEAIRPDLHKPLADFILDQSFAVKTEGVKALGRLKADGKPALGVLIAISSFGAAGGKIGKNRVDEDRLQRATYNAIKQIEIDDLAHAKTMMVIAGPNTKSIGHREGAIEVLIDWVEKPSDEADRTNRKKQLIPIIKSGLLSGDPEFQIACMNLAAAYGPLSKELLPILRDFKLSKTASLRDTATKAVTEIEGK